MVGKEIIKKAFCLVFFLFALLPSRLSAADYPLLEFLIENHKKQSNRLLTRVEERGLLVAAALLEKDTSGDYTQVAKSLANKGGNVLSYITFGVEMGKVVMDVVDLGKLEASVISRAIEVSKEHPYILVTAADVEYQVGEILAEVTRNSYFVLSSSLGVTLATQEQRMEFVNTIKGALWRIKYRLNNLLWECDMATFRPSGTMASLEDFFKEAKKSQESASSSVIREITGIFVKK